MNGNEIVIWKGSDGITMPASTDPKEIVECANKSILSEKQQQQIITAFNMKAFDMGAEYAWRRAMTTLKESIASLGMKFVGEMLEREDINEFTSPELALTDYAAITLADQLGIIGKTGALKLRQSLELLNHFFSKDCTEDLSPIDALNIVGSSIQYVLGEQQVSVAVEFTQLRNRLESESLNVDDSQLQILVNSALFHMRTVLNILLSNIKSLKGGQLEHSLINLNVILPLVWDKIADKDKWNVGEAYRDVVAEGNDKSSNGMKKALLKVRGFDFVPETLRSSTFKRAAKAVIDTHFAFNNFYNEPSVVSSLSNLGTIIPAPALQDCMDAYLLVFLGNKYGVSDRGAALAEKELKSIASDRWHYFFDRIIAKDELLISNLYYEGQINRFEYILKATGNDDFDDIQSKSAQNLYDAILRKDTNSVRKIRYELLDQL